MTKRSPVARYVHPEADLHAYRNPQIKVKVPRSARELAKFLRRYAETAAGEYSRIIRARFGLRMPTDRDFIEIRDELLRASNEMFEQYNPDFKRATKELYEIGATGATYAIGAQRGSPPGKGFSYSFTKPDIAAMAAIANDNFSDLAGQTTNMITGAVGILRTQAGKIIRRRLAQGIHPTQVARDLEVELIRRGFKPSEAIDKFFKWRDQHKNPYSGARPSKRLVTPADAVRHIAEEGHLRFIDKAGREWDLRDYCEMAAHTKLMIAKNEGTRNVMKTAGVNHYIFSQHGTDCDICGPHEGQVYWTGDGDSLGHDVGPSIPLHPNCGHTTIPYVVEAYS
jgi:hypothetical protein